MALSYAKVRDGESRVGRRKHQYWDITGDNSYPTGGYTISAAKVGLKTIQGIEVIRANTAAVATSARWNSTTGKLMLYNGSTQVSNATNVSGYTYRIIFIGV